MRSMVSAKSIRATLILTGCSVVAALAGCSDPCRNGKGAYSQLHPENYEFFSCNGQIYYTDVQPKRYNKAAVDVDSFSALPGQFGVDKDHFYFVAIESATPWGHSKLRIIPGVDNATAKVIDQDRVQDQDHTFVVLDRQVFIRDKEGRLVKEIRFDDD